MKKLFAFVLSFLFFGLLSAVSVELLSPANDSYTNSTSQMFRFNATDDLQQQLNCSIYINGINRGTALFNNGSDSNFVVDLTSDVNNGISTFMWYINCSNSTDYSASEVRKLGVDFYPVNVSFTIVGEPDYFVSSDSANNQITLLVNASDIGPSGIDYITANFTALNQSGIDYVNMTYNNITGLWSATITVTDVSMFEFTPVNISIFGQDKAGNGLVGWTKTTVILYNMSTPPTGTCQAWGPLMTDLTKVSNFNSVNFVIDLQMNISCLMNTTFGSEYPSWLNEMTTLAVLNFSNLNLSNQSIGMKLGSLFQHIQVNITLPGEFGDSRIYVNSTALEEFDTNTTIKLFHLPFLSKPAITLDQDAEGLDESFEVIWEQGMGEGNITFRVKGFSGYNITDNTPPIITFENIANGSYVNSSTPLINITLNGTKTMISYLLVKIDNTNLTANETNCQQTSNPEIMSCVFTSSNLSQGNHTLFVLARDYGGSNGNSANKTIVFFVDSIKPVLNVTTPQNDSEYSSVTLQISGTSSDLNLNYTNVSVYNSTGNLVNSSITTNSTWIIRFLLTNDSTYNVTVTAYDKAGNYETVLIKNITIKDSDAPNITAISSTTSGSTVTLSVTTNEFAVCRYATSDVAYENMSNMTTTGGLSHSHSITYSSSTSGTYYVRCADPIGNVMNSSNSTSFSVTISGGSGSSSQQTTNVTPSTPITPPTPPVTQPQPEETPTPTTPVSVVSSTASAAVFSLNAAAGDQVTIDIAKLASGVAQGTGITKISISTSTGLSNVQVSIKPVEKPASVQEPSKKVLNYIEINFGASGAVQSAKITFTLKKSDIRKQNVDPDSIKLLRYANGQWQELQTVKGFEDIDSITFEATSPGFSYFAIAGDEIQAPIEKPKVTTTTGGEEKPEITVLPEKKEESPLGLILLIAVILIIGYIVLSSQKPWKTK